MLFCKVQIIVTMIVLILKMKTWNFSIENDDEILRKLDFEM